MFYKVPFFFLIFDEPAEILSDMDTFHSVRKTLFSRVRKRLIVLVLLFFVRIAIGLLPQLFFGHEPVIYQSLTALSFFVIASAFSGAAESLFSDTSLRDRLSDGLKNLFHKIIRVIVYAMAALLSLEHFGISVTPILASLGVGSIAIALALQDTLGNLFSGFYLLIDQPFEIGHLVRIEGGLEGKVSVIGWRSTRVLLGSGHLLILPNSKLSSSTVINMSLPTPESIVQVKLGVKANQDVAVIEQTCLLAANKTQQELYPLETSVFSPSVRFIDIGPATIELVVTTKAKDEPMTADMKHALIKNLILGLQKQGISLKVRA